MNSKEKDSSGWPWAAKLAIAWRAALGWIKEHKLLSAIAVVVLLSIIGMQALSELRARESARELARVSALPATTLAKLVVLGTAGQIQTLRSHEFEGKEVALEEILEARLKNGSVVILPVIPDAKESIWKEIVFAAQKGGVVIENGYRYRRNIPWHDASFFTMFAALILFLLVAIFATERSSRKADFSGSRLDQNITLEDVVGYDLIKREMREVVDQFLRSAHYEKQGVRPPRGVLMTGDPGVGKSMLARALANEVKAKFFTVTGAEFAEMFVGTGPARVKQLFAEARRAGLAMIFIDEIDAMGSRENLTHDSERQATLNQMLAELDGVQDAGNILILAATNFPERLDPALVRPGRFDKRIHIPLPDPETRRKILIKYAGASDLSAIDMNALALRTAGYSPAQLRGMVNEAKSMALRRATAQDAIVKLTQEDLETAQEIALMGVHENAPEPALAHRIAVHELGHALAGYLHCADIHVEKVTIVGRGGALGYTLTRPLTEGALKTEGEMRATLCMMLGGRAAEQVMLGSVSSGASDDLARANDLARKMVCQLGMGRQVGLSTAGPDAASGPSRDLVEEDVREILDEAYARAMSVMTEQRAWLQEMTAGLLDAKFLSNEILFQGVERRLAAVS